MPCGSANHLVDDRGLINLGLLPESLVPAFPDRGFRHLFHTSISPCRVLSSVPWPNRDFCPFGGGNPVVPAGRIFGPCQGRIGPRMGSTRPLVSIRLSGVPSTGCGLALPIYRSGVRKKIGGRLKTGSDGDRAAAQTRAQRAIRRGPICRARDPIPCPRRPVTKGSETLRPGPLPYRVVVRSFPDTLCRKNSGMRTETMRMVA